MLCHTCFVPSMKASVWYIIWQNPSGSWWDIVCFIFSLFKLTAEEDSLDGQFVKKWHKFETTPFADHSDWTWLNAVQHFISYWHLSWIWLVGHCDLILGWLVVSGLTALWDSISVYIGPSPREREKEVRNDRRETQCPINPNPHLLQAL